MSEIKNENVYDAFSKYKKILDLNNYFAKSKYYNDLNVLVVGRIKDKMGGVAF